MSKNQMLKNLIAEAKELREDATDKARMACNVVRSKGVELSWLDSRGELIDREWEVKLTQKEIRESVARALEGLGPEVAKFALTGAISGADSVWGLNNEDYEPEVETWGGREFTAKEIGVTA